jgi:hypothetical protein
VGSVRAMEERTLVAYYILFYLNTYHRVRERGPRVERPRGPIYFWFENISIRVGREIAMG